MKILRCFWNSLKITNYNNLYKNRTFYWSESKEIADDIFKEALVETLGLMTRIILVSTKLYLVKPFVIME